MSIATLVFEYLTKARAKVQRTWIPGKKAGVHYYLTAKNTKVYGKPGPGDKIAKPEEAAKRPAAKKPVMKAPAKNAPAPVANTPASPAKKPPQPKAKPVTATKDAPSVVNEAVDLYAKVSQRDVTEEQVQQFADKVKGIKDKATLRAIGEKITMEFRKSDTTAQMADKIAKRFLGVKRAAIKSTIFDRRDQPSTPKPAVIDNNAKAQPFTDRIAKGEKLEEDEYADYANILSNMDGADVKKHLEAIRGGGAKSKSPKPAQEPEKVKPSKLLSQSEFQSEVATIVDDLITEKHSSGLVPIHEVRAEIAAKHGDVNTSHKVFDAMIHQMRRDKKINMVPIDDRSKATPQQLQDAIPQGSVTFFYLEKPGTIQPA